MYVDKSRDVKRRQIPTVGIAADFKNGFPIVSVKETSFWNIATELSWFLRGETDIAFLKQRGVNIWDKDGYNWYVKDCEARGIVPISIQDWRKRVKDGDITGEVGKNYSHQWRNFGKGTDQLVNLILGMQENIMNTRLIVNAWNPEEVNETALPPCHYGFQIIGQPLTLDERLVYAQKKTGIHPSTFMAGDVEATLLEFNIPEYGFFLKWNQRSTDVFLGLPYNIASYALLAKFLGEITGYVALGIKAAPDCVHLYDNQFKPAKELVDRMRDLGRENMPTEVVFNLPTELVYKTGGFTKQELKNILDHVEPTWFNLIGYEPQPAINVEMLAPNKL